MTSELFAIGGFRKPNVQKKLKVENSLWKRKKVLPCSSTNVMAAHMLLRRTFVVYICLKGKKTRHQEILFSFMTHFMRCNIEEIWMKSSQNILTRLLWSDEPAFGEYKCWWVECVASTNYGFGRALCNYICIL